jgi:hypothetical protein
MNQAIAAYSARLPPRGVAELFASGIPRIASALHPPAKAYERMAAGGLLVRCRSLAAAIMRNGW